jgi:FAD-linked oxidoreductase
MNMSSASGSSWQNWAANQNANPQRILTPQSVADVAEAVRGAADDGLTIRMVGTGHSFSAAAVTDGVLLRPEGLTRLRSADAETGLVTAEAGMPLKVLNELLAREGLALANMGEIAEQTLAGAAQTATHGTGRTAGSLASQIAGLELVLADGSIVNCSADELPDLFDAARAGVGALGIVTAITWQTVPAFLLHSREDPMKWDQVLGSLDELAAENDHFEFWWYPYTDGCLVKRNNRTEGPAKPLSAFKRWLEDDFQTNIAFGYLNNVVRRRPQRAKPIMEFCAKRLSAREYTDASHKVFLTPRKVRFKEQEYAIPQEHLGDALREIRAIVDRHEDWHLSFPVEVRVLPAEDPWLSMNHGRASAFVAAHVFHPSAHVEYFSAVEEVLTSMGGRPHWGKMHTRDAGYLESVYPRYADFLALRDEFDPDRRFANAYTTEIFGK